jgi:hypothetical protein
VGPPGPILLKGPQLICDATVGGVSAACGESSYVSGLQYARGACSTAVACPVPCACGLWRPRSLCFALVNSAKAPIRDVYFLDGRGTYNSH